MAKASQRALMRGDDQVYNHLEYIRKYLLCPPQLSADILKGLLDRGVSTLDIVNLLGMFSRQKVKFISAETCSTLLTKTSRI